MRLKYVFILYAKPKNTIETHETPVKAMNLCVLEYKDLIILWATLMSNGFSYTSRT